MQESNEKIFNFIIIFTISCVCRYNFFNYILESEINGEILIKNYIKILTILSPIIPHFANECFQDLGISDLPKWPEVDKNKIRVNIVNFVVQINGKKKGTIKSNYNINEKDLLERLANDKNLGKLIMGKKIEKSFFVKNRLINILLK